MVDHFVWSVLAVPALTVLVTLLAADRMPPSRAAAVLAWSAAGAAGASTVTLFFFAVAAFAEVPLLGDWFGWSSAVVARDTAAVPWVPWLSVALLGSALATFAWTRRRQRRARSAAAGFADLPGNREVFVVPDAAPEAFSVEGRPGRIVVTTGMLRLLSTRQYAALLAHERAHLAGGHHRLVRLAELAASLHRLLRLPAARVGYLVERAADEAAVDRLGLLRAAG